METLGYPEPSRPAWSEGLFEDQQLASRVELYCFPQQFDPIIQSIWIDVLMRPAIAFGQVAVSDLHPAWNRLQCENLSCVCGTAETCRSREAQELRRF